MPSQSSQVLEQAQRLLQNKEITQALELLEGINSTTLAKSEYVDYCLVLSDARLLSGHQLGSLVDEAIELLRYGVDTDKFALAKQLRARYFIEAGKFDDAKEPLIEAYAGFLRCQRMTEAARTLSYLAFTYSRTGEIGLAIRELTRSIRIHDSADDKTRAVAGRTNLANLQLQTGKFRECLRLCKLLQPEMSNQGNKNHAVFLLTSAYSHAHIDDFKTAKANLKKALSLSEGYIREQAIYYEYSGCIAILAGDYKTAERDLKCGLEISMRIAPESALISQTKRLFGDLYVATGKFDLAQKFATEGLAVAEKIGEKVEIAACHRVFAQVAAHHGRADEAQEWFRKAIEMFAMIGAAYELAVTRYLASASNLFSESERTAMLYLAKDYFESEQIESWQKKVRTELAKSAPLAKTHPKDDSSPAHRSVQMVSASAEMKKILELVEHIAPSDMTMLLTGETGTGKDLLARYIHEQSGRTGEFVSVNAAAIPVSMIESELFGCAKGAFTGADKDRAGLFERADKGTLYLNEIGDAPAEMQAKLLEVIETRMVRRLGETKSRPVNFRLVAATNHDLRKRIDENLFRVDLYHRLNEVRVHLPSLAERKSDITPLVLHFIQECGHSGSNGNGQPEAVGLLGEWLSREEWPGNIRELRARVRYLYATVHGDLKRMLILARSNGHTS